MSVSVSVIIPVYNTASYLPACLDSILGQTYADFELLVVDDGSTDASPVICDDYAGRDSRVKVFHQTNAGVSAARNLALSHASGKWVCFVDSDDTVLPGYLEEMVAATANDDCLVMGNISDPLFEGLVTEDLSLQGKDMVDYMLRHALFNLCGPVAKLFSRKVLQENQIVFPAGIHYGEDLIFLLRYINKVEQVILRKSDNYRVTMREGSLSRGYYSFESEYACFQSCLTEMTAFVGRLDETPERQRDLIWRTRTAELFLHSVKSLYAGGCDDGWSGKMRRLHAIPKAYFQYFGIGFKPQSLTSQVISFLVQHRQFTLLLLLGASYERAHRMR